MSSTAETFDCLDDLAFLRRTLDQLDGFRLVRGFTRAEHARYLALCETELRLLRLSDRSVA